MEENKKAEVSAQKVPTSQGETMGTESGSQAAKENEGATNLVAGENNNNSINSKNLNSMSNSSLNSEVNSKEMGEEEENKEAKTIEQLRQDVEDAQKAIEENANGTKTKQKACVRNYKKARKALMTWLGTQILPLLPVQFWYTESNEKDTLTISKKGAEISIGMSPYNLQTSPAMVSMAAECLRDPLFEYDAPKYVVSADLFYNNGIELKDLNGNTIPKGTPNVYVPVGGADTHAVFRAAHEMNIEAETEGSPKITLTNLCVKNFNDMQELGKYFGNNTVLDRALNSKELPAIAALATEHDLMQEVFKLSIEQAMPKSTAYKYCALGARLTSKQWKEATRGILPKEVKYDLNIGQRIVDCLTNKGFGDLIKSRYLIDGITKFARQPQNTETEEANGFALTLGYLEQLTSQEVEHLIETHTDKTDMLYGFLVKKQTLASQQAA